jgi:hypothetical protein
MYIDCPTELVLAQNTKASHEDRRTKRCVQTIFETIYETPGNSNNDRVTSFHQGLDVAGDFVGRPRTGSREAGLEV